MVLLLLAELLADHAGDLGIEVVAMNGEDYYCNPGEQQWLRLNAGRFDGILLGINVDDVGYCKGKVAYSLYDCPPELASSIHKVFSGYENLYVTRIEQSALFGLQSNSTAWEVISNG